MRSRSGPLLDRVDLVLNLERPEAAQLAGGAVTTSVAERERVLAARERQAERLLDTPATCNAHMDSALLRTHAAASSAAQRTLLDAYRRGRLSARGRDRALRVARTIADLDGSDDLRDEHVAQALSLRSELPPVAELSA